MVSPIHESQLGGITILDKDGYGSVTVSDAVLKDSNALVLNEQATSPYNPSVSGDEGSLWVRDDGYLIFTDKTNIDTVLGQGGGGASSLQEAYEGGNTITTDAISGSFEVNGTQGILLDSAGLSGGVSASTDDSNLSLIPGLGVVLTTNDVNIGITAGGTGELTMQGSGVGIAASDSTTSGVAGSDVTISSGDGSGSAANGGSITMIAGDSDLWDSDGGSISLTGGRTNSYNGSGGSINLTGGFADGTNSSDKGGFINLVGGAGDYIGGDINLTSGDGGIQKAGSINITGGFTTGANRGGDINIITGDGSSGTGYMEIRTDHTASSNQSGALTIQTGDTTGTGNAGYFTIAGGDATGGGDGGSLLIKGGNSSTDGGGGVAIRGGNGVSPPFGSISIYAGNCSGTQGSDVTIRSGQGGSGQNGGTIALEAGLGDAGGGVRGNIELTADEVIVSNKLTVTGLIDPTGLVFEEQSTAPHTNTATEGMLWVKNDDASLVYTNQNNEDGYVEQTLKIGDGDSLVRYRDVRSVLDTSPVTVSIPETYAGIVSGYIRLRLTISAFEASDNYGAEYAIHIWRNGLTVADRQFELYNQFGDFAISNVTYGTGTIDITFTYAQASQRRFLIEIDATYHED